MERLKIAVAVDENYVYPLKVMLHSLFSTQRMPMTIYFLHSCVSKSVIRDLERYCASNGAMLIEVHVKNEMFSSAPLGRYFTMECYYRLLLPWILPDEDRILYLDPDLIVRHPLDELWETPLSGASIAGVLDRGINLNGTGAFSCLKKGSIYINSGVLLMDLKRIRTEKSIEEIGETLKKRNGMLMYPDQDLINLLWEGDIRRLDDCYNWNPNCLYIKEYLFMPWRKKSWKIIHYMGPDKPWKKGYKRNAYIIWAKEEQKTYPEKRRLIAARRFLEGYRYLYGIYFFIKQHFR